MLANIFCKGTDSKYFRFCRSCSLCHNYSILTLSLLVAIERCKEMKWSWLCATKASLQSVRSVAVTESFWLFATSWTAACQPSLSITNSWSLLKFKSIDSVMPCNHLILCRPPSLAFDIAFPASGSFPVSQFFASGGQRIRVSASASVLPMNIRDWPPLGWTGWISLQSKGLSRVFSNTTLQKHQFFGAQLSS